MREDLPHEEPLPALWSLHLAPGGDVINEGPLLEFTAAELLLRTCRHTLWRVEVQVKDGERHVLCETRFVLPESLAVPQLGKLRELMTREARLLDTLSHEYVVPLEQGWLEQRAGLEQLCSEAVSGHCRKSPRNVKKGQVERADAAPVPAEGGATSKELLADGSHPCRCWGKSDSSVLGGAFLWHLCLEGALAAPSSPPAAADADSTACRDRRRQEDDSTQCSTKCGIGPEGNEDAAAFLLRSWVPLTIEDGGGDDNITDFVRGLEQLQWGGDNTTDWKGTAEPKSSTHVATSCTRSRTVAPLPLNSSLVATGDGTSEKTDGGREIARRHGERMVSLASYLLLPDWLPLSVWFETEFEPRTVAPDGQDGAGITRAVTAPRDWELVWRHLMSMFLGVLRGVEHLHAKGFVHNNIHPCSLMVAADGRCCVGDLSQLAPPGCRKAAIEHHHFASPERRRGGLVDSFSDVYALGVLMLEFWRNYALSRGLGDLCLTGDRGLVETIKSCETDAAHLDEEMGLLDVVLVRSMLAEDPFDRPDCFEVVSSLGGSEFSC